MVTVLAALAPGAQRPQRTCSRKLQQQTRNLAVPNAPIRSLLGANDAQRGPLRHFASKGLGVRVPLAPLSHLVSGTFSTRRNSQRPEYSSKVQQQRGRVMILSGLRARSTSAFNALKVDPLLTWLYTSMVTAIWPWRSLHGHPRGWTSRPTSCAKTLSPGLTELTMGVERVASDHQGVNFAGPIEDLEGLAVPKQSLHAAAVVDAHGTEDLDRFDGVPHGRVGAE